MKKLKLILLIQALILGALTLNAEDCPCEGGTAPYSVDCDGDGTMDACSTVDCEPCEGGNPASTGMACCGDVEYDPSANIEKSWEIKKLKSAIESALAAIPYVSDPEAGANVNINFSPCCGSTDTVIEEGKGEISGDVSVSVQLEKTLSPFSSEFYFDIKGCGRVGASVNVGPFIELRPSLSAVVSGSVDRCDDTETWGASGTATGNVVAGVKAETKAIVCDKSVSANAEANASTVVTGSFSWNNNDGAEGKACVSDLFGNIFVEASIPFYGKKKINIVNKYVFLEGNCKA